MDGDGVRIKFSALPQKYGTFSLQELNQTHNTTQ